MHSKIYISDDCVIIGSANSSSNSKNALLESCVLIKRHDLAEEIIEWVEALPLVPIDDNWLDENKEKYKAPKWAGSASKKLRVESEIWITWVADELVEPDTETYHRNMAYAKGRLNVDTAQPWPISEGCREVSRMFQNVKSGDLVIAIDHEDHEINVWPPMRVLVNPWVEKIDKKPERFLFLEDNNSDPVKLSRFRSALLKAGVKGFPLNGKSNRTISHDVLRKIIDLWKV